MGHVAELINQHNLRECCFI